MEPISGSLNATGVLAKSGAHVVDQITGVGFGVTVLLLALIFSVIGNILQFKRNNSLVDQMFGILPQATAQVMQAIAEFKGVVHDLVQKN